MFAPVFVGHWYFWAAITATLAGILCACSLWRRHSSNNSWGGSGSSNFFCCGDDGGLHDDHSRASEPDSNGSCYAPPQYRSCSSFLQAPPPYSEVASKPELYPLVISFNGDPGVKTMVQYFRNFIVRPVGTLSATSTIDSLSSSFICNAANEANNIIPPPYSCMGSLEEVSSSNSPPLAAPAAAQSPQHPPPPPTTITPAVTLTAIQPPSATLPPPSTNNVDVDDVTPQQPSSTPPPPATLCDTSIQQHKINRLSLFSSVDDKPPKAHRVSSALKYSKINSKNASLESAESDECHNFSDLLNLSVCVTTMASSNGNNAFPQVDMMAHSCSNRVANSMTSSDISSLANLGTPDSPPRATSPTLEMRELLDKIQQLPQQHKSPVEEQAAITVQPGRIIKQYFSNRSKAKTLYMPLSKDSECQKSGGIGAKKGWLSRSAPTTPCGTAFLPNFPAPHFPAKNKNNANCSSSSTSNKSRTFDDRPLLHEEEQQQNTDEYL